MGIKIAYLDDEQDLCEVFSDIFSSPQVQIKTYCVPSEAIEAIRNESFDLIFLDYRLPGTNGEQVAESLNCKAPVFLVTGDVQVNYKFNFKQVFTKPLDIEKIQSVINMYLDLQKHAA